jgi:uncharacterized membrane protein/membrane-bound inhibitor of C-type lysozyme
MPTTRRPAASPHASVPTLGAALAACAACAACAGAPRGAAGTPPRAAAYVYTCGDATRFSVRYDPAAGGGAATSATLRLAGADDDREVRLAVDTAASGARFRGRDAAGAVTFWAHQGGATLVAGAGPARACRPRAAATPWDEARLLGADYRAVGQEPGWVVEVYAGRRLLFVGDYGSTRLTAPAPAPATETAAAPGGPPGANRVTYAARAGAHALTVEVVRQACRDEMSGEAFPTTAVVRLDGREYRGCGRWLGDEPRG